MPESRIYRQWRARQEQFQHRVQAARCELPLALEALEQVKNTADRALLHRRVNAVKLQMARLEKALARLAEPEPIEPNRG